ncbi:NAD(P)-binding domain-containing protein [Curtobacterium sp. MCBD17_030]|uniref:NAD(P)-binding domain-containing protein n=1 Tax=Curtobacterium sp. MCBD17_030 TaxID=2175649 RepID=UPI0015E88372
MGTGFAEAALAAGHNVILANSRGPESLADVVSALGDGARADTVLGAAENADMVLLAVPLHRYADLVQPTSRSQRAISGCRRGAAGSSRNVSATEVSYMHTTFEFVHSSGTRRETPAAHRVRPTCREDLPLAPGRQTSHDHCRAVPASGSSMVWGILRAVLRGRSTEWSVA